MIDFHSCPRLAPKVRVRFDSASNQFLLLRPERAMALDATAIDIVRLCTGERTVEGIIAELCNQHSGQKRTTIEQEVLGFLALLRARALVLSGTP